ncbi:MAG TPA: adenosylcobinamide-GDP ribazoletransferase [Candidatus Limnocylindrales bacterium]|nr:adenosylcobinamide-GDP ribazoletransferase [Candidatus Limnocylindrales bacterium]
MRNVAESAPGADRRPRIRPWAELRGAAGLLTRLPVAAGDTAGAAAFPLVGAAIGVAGMAPILLLGDRSPALAALLALATTAIVTGAIHLDAVADTADALLARDPASAELARRDPRLGTGGVIALVFVVAVEAVALTGVVNGLGALTAWLGALTACAASRAAPVLVALLAADRVSNEGSGAWFVRQVDTASAAGAVALAITVAVVAGLASGDVAPGIAIGGAALGAVLGLGVVSVRGQLDGDGLGASTELAFAAALVVTAVAVA